MYRQKLAPAEYAGIAVPTYGRVVCASRKGMGTVLKQHETVAIAQFTELPQVLRKSKVMDSHYHFRAFSNLGLDLPEIRLTSSIDAVKLDLASIFAERFYGGLTEISWEQNMCFRRNFQCFKRPVNGVSSPKEPPTSRNGGIRAIFYRPGEWREEFPAGIRFLGKQEAIWIDLHAARFRSFLRVLIHEWRRK